MGGRLSARDPRGVDAGGGDRVCRPGSSGKAEGVEGQLRPTSAAKASQPEDNDLASLIGQLLVSQHCEAEVAETDAKTDHEHTYPQGWMTVMDLFS